MEEEILLLRKVYDDMVEAAALLERKLFRLKAMALYHHFRMYLPKNGIFVIFTARTVEQLKTFSLVLTPYGDHEGQNTRFRGTLPEVHHFEVHTLDRIPTVHGFKLHASLVNDMGLEVLPGEVDEVYVLPGLLYHVGHSEKKRKQLDYLDQHGLLDSKAFL